VNFGSLALEVTNVGLKAVILLHFDSEKVVVILLDLLARGVLSEEHSVTSSKLWREWGDRE